MLPLFVVLICALLIADGDAFRAPVLVRRAMHSTHQLNMVDVEGASDPLDAIRAKVANDPSYNPMNDPEAMGLLESMLPEEMKEFPNALERLKVALQDATTGADSVSDIDKFAADIGNKKELISSPTSQWFKDGMPESGAKADQTKLKDLAEKLKAKYPDIPTV